MSARRLAPRGLRPAFRGLWLARKGLQLASRGSLVLLAAGGVLALTSASALGASPPTVNDRAAFASNASQFAATLNATIDPEGVPTSYHFEYGTTPAYGSLVPVPDDYVPVNEEDDAVSQTLEGLAPGTTYYFAVVANSPAGDVTGPQETFTTLPVPAPEVATGGASEVTVGAVTLSGAVDPEGFETSYLFEYGPSTAYGLRWPGTGVALGGLSGAQPVVSYVQNLQPGTVYHYRLVATNPGGVGYGADQTFTTPEYPASVIQEAPVLSTPLGISTRTSTSTTTKSSGKGKRKQSKRKAKARKRVKAKRNAKGGKRRG
jgi:hypothetical protein